MESFVRNKRFSHPSAALYLYNNIQPLTSARLQTAADFFWGSAKWYTPKSLIAVTFSLYYGYYYYYYYLLRSTLLPNCLHLSHVFPFGVPFRHTLPIKSHGCFKDVLFFCSCTEYVHVHMYGYVS